MKTPQSVVIATLAFGLSLSAQANLSAIERDMNAFQKPMVDSLRSVLEKDPEFSKEFKDYRSALKALENVKDDQARFKDAVAINEKHREMFDRAMKKSKADPEQSRKYAMSLEKKYSTKKRRYKVQPGLYMTYQAWGEGSESEAPPVETEVLFQAPYAFEHSAENGGGEVSSDLENGKLRAYASAVLMGSFQNKAGVGDYIRLPWANRTVRVSAKLPQTSVYLGAYSGPGGAGARGASVIDLLGEDGQVCIKQLEHGVVYAPVIWFTSVTLTDTTLMSCEMESPPANQDLTIRFQAIAEVTVGGASTATAQVISRPDPVRVRLIQ